MNVVTPSQFGFSRPHAGLVITQAAGNDFAIFDVANRSEAPIVVQTIEFSKVAGKDCARIGISAPEHLFKVYRAEVLHRETPEIYAALREGKPLTVRHYEILQQRFRP